MFVICFALTSSAVADTTGTIRGTVIDTSGAVLQNANVEITNAGTGEVRRMVSDANGNFQFPLLPVGIHTLHVERSGSSTYVSSKRALIARSKAT